MPEVTQVHVDVALTNVSLAYRNPAFIADLVAPPVGVRKQQDKYFVYDSDREAFRSTSDLRAPGAEANEVDFALSTDTYYCEDHALVSVIPDEERDNADPAIQPDIDRTEFLSDKIDLNKEIELANVVATDASLPGTTLSGDDQWSDADSDPFAAIEAGKASVIEKVQVMPNTLVLPYEVYTQVRLHEKVLAHVHYSGNYVPTAQVLAELFDIERILVPRAVKNTALPGNTPAMSYVWGKNAFLCYVPPRAALKTVSFAHTFAWTSAPGAIGGRLVEKWRDHARKSDVVRVQRYYDQKVIASDAIYVWKAAVA
ncbi:hypothetical protein JW916_07475 [Candidatus Sumerlaeota bacterium]|nr:hypothetical protein [Candidatus Sumerlaeota bacterium]